MTSETLDSYSVATPNRIRRVMATRMRLSAAEIPQVTLHATADARALADLTAGAAFPGGPRITVTVRLLQVVAHTLLTHPRLNSTVVDGETRLHHDVNLGVATATSHGLLVPVVPRTTTLSLGEIATRLADLRKRGEGQSLGYEDFADGTFTVTNLGGFGIDHFSPLVNPPQVAILGVGTITRRPAFSTDDAALARHDLPPITTRHDLPLSLTFDHAAVDGAEAASYLRDLTAAIESPSHP